MIRLSDLRDGEMIRNKLSGECYIVIVRYPAIIAVRDVEVTNEHEWERVSRVEYVRPEEERGRLGR